MNQIGRSRLLCVMKNAAATILAILFLAVGATAQNPVVVELFTSEGCSSCPPADAVLLQLSGDPRVNGVPVILLGEHVDYWNYIGWTDRFSSKQFSNRQSDYAAALHASVYTPQMVIDGREAFVGNDAAEVRRQISAAAKDAKPAQVSLSWKGSEQLQVRVHAPQTTDGQVLLAITEDGLSTQVGNGENGGKTLHHAAVVRRLVDLGALKNGSFEKVVQVSAQQDWRRDELKAIVLVQETGSRKILGAGVVKF